MQKSGKILWGREDTRVAVDMKFPIHVHIHRFCVDIHGYIHIHRCMACVDVSTDCPQSTVGFYCLLVLKIYKRENKMFAFDETKEYVFIKCTYMYFLVHVISCNYSCQHKKIEKMKQTKSQTQSHLVISQSQVFVLYFIFALISFKFNYVKISMDVSMHRAAYV